MRIGVTTLAVCVFVAALMFDTGALVRLPFACASGGCGPHSKWVVAAVFAALVLLAAAAFVHCRRGGITPRAHASKRKPACAEKERGRTIQR